MIDLPSWPVATFFIVALLYGALKAVCAMRDRPKFRRVREIADVLWSRPGLTKADKKVVLAAMREATNRRSAITAVIVMVCLMPLIIVEFALCAARSGSVSEDPDPFSTPAGDISQTALASMAGVQVSDVTIWDDPLLLELTDLAVDLEFTGSPVAYVLLIVVLGPIILIADALGETAIALAAILRRLSKNEREPVARAVAVIAGKHER